MVDHRQDGIMQEGETLGYTESNLHHFHPW
jgi:hypothetical protein